MSERAESVPGPIELPDYTELDQMIAMQQAANEAAARELQNSQLREALTIAERNAARWGQIVEEGQRRLDAAQAQLQKAIAEALAALQTSNEQLAAVMQAEVARLLDKSAAAAATASKRIADAAAAGEAAIRAAQEHEEQAVQAAGREAVREINRVAAEAARRDDRRQIVFYGIVGTQILIVFMAAVLVYKLLL